MKRIAFIGCGGINSWAIHHFHDVIKIFEKENLVYVKLFDNDIVEEKNILRSNQNFAVDDLLLSKAEVLSKKYNFDYENVFITEANIDDIAPFDDIILGVDNNKTRRLFYDYCLKNKKYLLDLRAQGTQMEFHILDLNKDIDYYDKLLFYNNDVMERKGSCQLKADVQNDHIENGNQIIAMIGMRGLFFKRLRDETPLTNDWKWVY